MIQITKGCAGLAVAMAAFLAGCSQPVPPHLKPLSAEAQALLEEKGMRQDQPIFMRVFKEESELEVWKAKDDGSYHHFKTYPICNYSGKLGPKVRIGDLQAPEGFYNVKAGQMNPASKYHLAFNIGFPNSYDRSLGRTGKHLMIHGNCKSAGCYAMTDALMEEIYILARESLKGGQESFEVHAFPFHMTNENINRHRRNKWTPFWRNLKKGYDHFEVVKQPPPVEVCEKRYLVNVAFVDGDTDIDPEGACPIYQHLPRKAVPPAPMYREANGSAPQLLNFQETPVLQAAFRRPVQGVQQQDAPQTVAVKATIGHVTSFRFAPAKPTIAGFAFRLNSKLDR